MNKTVCTKRNNGVRGRVHRNSRFDGSGVTRCSDIVLSEPVHYPALLSVQSETSSCSAEPAVLYRVLTPDFSFSPIEMHAYGPITACEHVSHTVCNGCEPVVEPVLFPIHYGKPESME